MTAAAVLFTYAVLLLTAAARLLDRARWPDRAPRLAVAAWFTVAGSSAASVILGAMAPMLASCLPTVRAHHGSPAGIALAGAGAFLALALTVRVTWCTLVTLTGASRARRRHRRQLALAGRADNRLGAIVVGHGEPAAYCLAGRSQPVVLTSAALAVLDEAQLGAVMAHERAHQRGRHHLLVALAGSLAAAFPRVRGLRRAHEQIACLVELLADDAAAAASHRLNVAEALLALAAPAPAAALGAGGPATAARIRRLITAPAPLDRSALAAGVAAVAAVVAFPLTVAAGGGGCQHGHEHPPAAVRTVASPVSPASARADAGASRSGLA